MSRESSDLVADIAKQRDRLEENLAKLQKSLGHWQKWEIDYGELKEKLEYLEEPPAVDNMRSIRDSIGPNIISDSEIVDLLGLKSGHKRDREQVLGMITRRIDYGQQNVESLRKQIESAEQQLEELDGSDEDHFQDEEGLPITEILEELDDEGNVMSSSVSTAKDAASSVTGFLGKAGVREWKDPMPEHEPSYKRKAGEDPISVPNTTTSKESQKQVQHSSGSQSILSPAANTSESVPAKRKKSVSFAPDISVAPSSGRRTSSPPPAGLPPTPIKSKFNGNWEVEESRRGRFHTGTRVIELNDNDEEIGSLPVVAPDDESPEDAALRREMTQYALSEVGAVVAEMNIDDDDGFGDEEDDIYDVSDEDDEEENEYGMTAHDRLTEDDRKQMLELEKKLNARMMHNLGPRPATDNLDNYADDVRRLVVQDKAESTNATGHARRPSKEVHFADEAEILPTPVEPPSATADGPMSDIVVERAGNSSGNPVPDASEPQRKQSRFKKTMSENPRTATDIRNDSQKGLPGVGTANIPIHLREDQFPTRKAKTPEGPPGKTLSSNVLERIPQPDSVMPPDESGIDPALVQQELAVENRRLFNNMVQKQGGFKPSPEDEENPLMEEQDGKIKRVSRFKAARLNAAGE